MSVRIIRPSGPAQYSIEPRKVRIEFKDGSHLVGYINIHSRYVSQDDDDNSIINSSQGELAGKFFRTSDFLKFVNSSDGVITVYDASYAGFSEKICFVFLHSVKLIMEEPEIKLAEPKTEEAAKPKEEVSSFSLRDKLKKP